MLRLVQPRSAMSLGSWGLAAFGAATGGAAMLQLAEDLAGPASPLARASRGAIGRGIHLTALPLALFVGGYTGTLLASTSTPAWARRRLTLPPLFLASGVASGLTATAALVDKRTSPSNPARRRLARASTVALAAELALTLADDLAASTLPSQRSAPPGSGVRRALALIAGTLAPLVLAGSNSRRRTAPLLTAALALGGSLALRYRITNEGYRSVQRAADTWALARGPDQAESAAQRRA
jgi:formate-dependent nitrite reductase membrane component NrfD